MVKWFSAGVSCSQRFFWPVGAALASAEIFRQARLARMRDLAAPSARSFAGNLAPLRTEGTGKTGCAPHPRSRVQCALGNAHTSIQVWRRHPAFPAQWLYGLYEFAPVTGFLATVISGSPRET